MSEEVREGVAMCIVCLRKNGCVCQRVMEHFGAEEAIRRAGLASILANAAKMLRDLERDLDQCEADQKYLLAHANDIALAVDLTVEAPNAEVLERVKAIRRERDELKWMREGLEK